MLHLEPVFIYEARATPILYTENLDVKRDIFSELILPQPLRHQASMLTAPVPQLEDSERFPGRFLVSLLFRAEIRNLWELEIAVRLMVLLSVVGVCGTEALGYERIHFF